MRRSPPSVPPPDPRPAFASSASERDIAEPRRFPLANYTRAETTTPATLVARAPRGPESWIARNQGQATPAVLPQDNVGELCACVDAFSMPPYAETADPIFPAQF